jgi:hypothetical protein
VITSGDSAAASPAMLWAGRVMSGLVIVFLIFDVGIKLIRHPIVAETMVQIGWAPEMGFTIGVIEAICLVLYVVPQTAVLGAILWTAVFGGAIATHLRLADPLFTHVLFGVYLGLLLWGGLYFRDARLRALIPLRRPPGSNPV